MPMSKKNRSYPIRKIFKELGGYQVGNLTVNFDREEFACNCCGQVKIEPSFLERLNLARTLAGTPFRINSGYRCSKHNREVGSESLNHESGRAADIAAANGPERRKILTGLVQAGFNRLGIGKTFIHADNMDEIGSPKSFWVY